MTKILIIPVHIFVIIMFFLANLFLPDYLDLNIYLISIIGGASGFIIGIIIHEILSKFDIRDAVLVDLNGLEGPSGIFLINLKKGE